MYTYVYCKSGNIQDKNLSLNKMLWISNSNISRTLIFRDGTKGETVKISQSTVYHILWKIKIHNLWYNLILLYISTTTFTWVQATSIEYRLDGSFHLRKQLWNILFIQEVTSSLIKILNSVWTEMLTLSLTLVCYVTSCHHAYKMCMFDVLKY